MKASELKGLTEAQVIAKVGPLYTADQQKTGILACISMAQFIRESGYGKSELAQNANNCHGMKCSLSGNTWPGSTWDGTSKYTKKTPEQKANGTTYYITADFRRYDTIEESIGDHSAYLLGAKNGSKLRYEKLIGCTDYKKVAKYLKDGGYATDTKYVSALIELVERWDLTKYNANTTDTTVSAYDGLYRVRSARDKQSSQKGAFSSLTNAKSCCDKYDGYFVFTDHGIPIYPLPFMATTTTSMDYYKSSNGAAKAGVAAKGKYTITDVDAATGYGKLKSGAGWLPLAGLAVSKAGTGCLALAEKWMPVVYDKVVELGCKHESGAKSYEEIVAKKITTCSTSVSAVLQKAGVLSNGKLVSHTAKDGDGGSTKTTIAKAISGTGNLVSGTYDIVKIGKTYPNMDSKYKKPGIVYVQDSNICMCAGDGVIYSTNEGTVQYKNGHYVQDKVSSGYPFTSKILYAIVPRE
jgi:hypothetical protein